MLEIAGSDGLDACEATLGLAHLAYRRERHDEALAHADTLLRALVDVGAPDPTRTTFRIAAVVVHLRVAEARGQPTCCGTCAPKSWPPTPRPLLGAWAMGGAELAAFRGDAATARDLWAMGMRVDANVNRFFPQGRGERLADALGEFREPLPAEARGLATAVVYGRVSALMDDIEMVVTNR